MGTFRYTIDSSPPRTLRKGNVWSRSLHSVAQLLKPGHNRITKGSVDLLDQYSLPIPEVPPDDHVACLDIAYFLIEKSERWDLHDELRAGTGSRKAVGTHMRFQPDVVELSHQYLRKTFGSEPDETIPPVRSAHTLEYIR